MTLRRGRRVARPRRSRSSRSPSSPRPGRSSTPRRRRCSPRSARTAGRAPRSSPARCSPARSSCSLPRRFAWVDGRPARGRARRSPPSTRRCASPTPSAHEQQVAEGTGDRRRGSTPRDVGDATLLVTGDRLWTATARTIFWNRSIDDVVLLRPATTPFPPVTRAVEHRRRRRPPDRRRRAAPTPIVVAPTTLVARGREGRRATGRHERDAGPRGVAAGRRRCGPCCERRGFLPNGDFTGPRHGHGLRLPARDARRDDPREDRRPDRRPRRRDLRVSGSRPRPRRRRRTTSRRRRTPTGPAPAASSSLNPGYAGTTTIAFTPR